MEKATNKKKRSQTDNDVQNNKQHDSDKQRKPLHQTNEKIKTCSKPLICNSICNKRLQEMVILRQHRQRLEQLTTRYHSKLKWQNSLNRHCTCFYPVFNLVHTCQNIQHVEWATEEEEEDVSGVPLSKKKLFTTYLCAINFISCHTSRRIHLSHNLIKYNTFWSEI